MKIFFLYWLISGIICLLFSCVECHRKDIKRELEEEIFDSDSELLVGVTFLVVYAFLLLFGFIILPVTTVRNVILKIKGDMEDV